MMTERASSAAIARDLKAWAIGTALPFWADKGVDRTRGGFHECLHWDGSPNVEVAKRLLVQARQVYVYAHAAALGWFPQGRAIALNAFDFMLSRFHRRDGRPGFAHLIQPDGTSIDPLRDTYDHAFVLLALAWVYRATGDAQVAGLIADVLAFVDEHLARDGSLIEGIPEALPRRQNPHMHMFEAMLALHQAAGHARALDRAAQLRALLERRFFDPKTQTIGEYFTDGWQPAPGPEGDSVEPGHFAEWAWLLRQHDALLRASPTDLPTELLRSALRWTESATGFLVDEGDRSGSVRRDSRRLWPQTELAKAWLAEAEVGRADTRKATAVLHAIKAHYLDVPFAGGWIDQFDRSGRALANFVPASSLYHVFCAIAEADHVLVGRTVSLPDQTTSASLN